MNTPMQPGMALSPRFNLRPGVLEITQRPITAERQVARRFRLRLATG